MAPSCGLFTLHRLFTAAAYRALHTAGYVPERRVVDYEANQHELVNVAEAPLPQTGSSRYLLTWNLLCPGGGKNYVPAN